MCGVFGAVNLSGRVLDHRGLMPAMATALHHRGPDGARLFRSSNSALGATRLRIIDPTRQADQPFHTPGGATWLACNGEIYNSGALRRRFPEYSYRSRTDIETILPAYRALGLDVFQELDGMFAVAIWDAGAATLILARDRAGEKPLFYARVGEEVWFASEIQALLEHPGIRREVDAIAVSQYLRLGYSLEPRTLFEQIRRVESGTALIFDGTGMRMHRFWDPRDFLRLENSAPMDRQVDELRTKLDAAVRRQLAADAAIGVFLSGGLDSSIIAAVAAQAMGRDRVTSFTARFAADSYDEGDWATRSARRAGTRHVDVDCGESQLLHALRNVSSRVAEPVSDPAILPTFLLAETASRHVRVVLGGEGADELFGGYPTYIGHKVAERISSAPGLVKRAVVRLVESLPVSKQKVSIEFLLKRFVRGFDLPWPERHVRWFGAGGDGVTLAATGIEDWLGPVLAGWTDLDAARGPMLFDYETYLRNQLLVKMDRATMLNSVEARAPFLDWSLSAFAFAIPARHKVRGITTKWILKKAAEVWLPRDQIVRRKRGLSVPISLWINGGLRAIADLLLAPARLDKHGLIDSVAVQRLLLEHRSNRANHAGALWSVVMLQLWLERWQPSLECESPVGELVALPRATGLREIWPASAVGAVTAAVANSDLAPSRF